jgi:hypothetical protein
VPFLAVAGLIQTQDAGRRAQRLAQQVEPLTAQRLHRPLRLGQEVVQGLGLGMDGLAQAWQ